VDGFPRDDWAFRIQCLLGDHYLTVARAPPKDMIDAYGEFKSTFDMPALDSDAWEAAIGADWPSFEELTVIQLVPPHLRWV